MSSRSCASRRRSKTPSPTKRERRGGALDARCASIESALTQHLPYRRLAGFYFFYFAYLGTFAPFFGLYLESVGLTPFDIGVLLSLPQITRIIAPHVWSWLAGP